MWIALLIFKEAWRRCKGMWKVKLGWCIIKTRCVFMHPQCLWNLEHFSAKERPGGFLILFNEDQIYYCELMFEADIFISKVHNPRNIFNLSPRIMNLRKRELHVNCPLCSNIRWWKSPVIVPMKSRLVIPICAAWVLKSHHTEQLLLIIFRTKKSPS